MAYLRKTKGRNGKPRENWVIEFTDWTGKRRSVTGFKSKKESERLAAKIEAEQAAIRKGLMPPPKTWLKEKGKSFAETVDEYFDWGNANGGRRGKGWGEEHARVKRLYLDWWRQRLNLSVLGDLDGIMPRVEESLREVQAKGRSGRTLQNYLESLKSFCIWAVKRQYLECDPLEGFVNFDVTPEKHHRALTPEELRNLISVAPPYRKLLYLTAVCTGLRANEIRSLQEEHLSIERCDLVLDDNWTKNRQPGRQPIPMELTSDLARFLKNGEAKKLYQKALRRKSARRTPPEAPLLYVPKEPSEGIRIDLKKAEIPRSTPAGSVDFHAMRTTFSTLLDAVGATERENQALMRHSPQSMTYRHYTKVSEARKRELVESVYNLVTGNGEASNRGINAERLAAGAENLYPVNASTEIQVGSTPTLSRHLLFVS